MEKGKRFFGETFVSHATRILCDTGYRRNSLREGGEREEPPCSADRGNDKRKGGKKGGGCNAGCWGKGKISAWVSRERLRDRGDGRLNIGFSDARGTYLMSYIFRWPAQFKFPFTENSPGGRGKGEGGKLRYLALNY